MASTVAEAVLRVIVTAVGIPPGFSPGAQLGAYINMARETTMLHPWPDLEWADTIASSAT